MRDGDRHLYLLDATFRVVVAIALVALVGSGRIVLPEPISPGVARLVALVVGISAVSVALWARGTISAPPLRALAAVNGISAVAVAVWLAMAPGERTTAGQLFAIGVAVGFALIADAQRRAAKAAA